MFDVKPCTSRKSTDCGAACMVSFLGYYGDEVTLEQMLKECNITVSGCTGKDLMKVGRNHGLDMKAYKTDAADVLTIDRPAICHWKYSHWIIFCGTNDDGNVVICNPSRGRYAIDRSLFEAFFSGVIIVNGELPDEEEQPEGGESND